MIGVLIWNILGIFVGAIFLVTLAIVIISFIYQGYIKEPEKPEYKEYVKEKSGYIEQIKLHENNEKKLKREIGDLNRNLEMKEGEIKGLKKGFNNEIASLRKQHEEKIYYIFSELDTGEIFNLGRFIGECSDDLLMSFDKELNQLIRHKVVFYIKDSEKLVTKKELQDFFGIEDIYEIQEKFSVTRLIIPEYLLKNSNYSAAELKNKAIINEFWESANYCIARYIERDEDKERLKRALKAFNKEMIAPNVPYPETECYFHQLLEHLENDVDKYGN